AAVESPRALAPLIDPNVHSCGTVRPHGAEELKHPETDFYIVGMKSYGRAPTFLLLTGYEQVRSVVCALVGDREGARQVQLELPETGVCSLAPLKDAVEQALPCCGSAAVAVVEGALAKAAARSKEQPKEEANASCCAPSCCGGEEARAEAARAGSGCC
ncbi:MAG TPA: hypothetical protein VJ885_03025, partial [Thermoanaerobaculia bacterium]|nr:hypothetical protein [Thermoanaerobaculia bacterium]